MTQDFPSFITDTIPQIQLAQRNNKANSGAEIIP